MDYSDKIIAHYEHPNNVGNFGTQAEVKTRKDIGVGLVGAAINDYKAKNGLPTAAAEHAH